MRVRKRDEERAYKAAFSAIMADFHAGKIGVDTKRERIAELNEFYWGDKPAALTRARVLVTSPAWVDDEPVREWWKD